MSKNNIGSPDDILLTVEELAARLRVQPSWVYTHADELGAFRLGNTSVWIYSGCRIGKPPAPYHEIGAKRPLSRTSAALQRGPSLVRKKEFGR
jgi:hypothetical protein